jgi:glycosyltransferase involved in cell wall biosynthesis
VSVVIPTRDRAERLLAIVQHLLAQTVAIDELIVVDQSATDAGAQAVAAAIAGQPEGRRPALTYVWDRSISGAAAARNAGLDRARGTFVVCVDDDMVPDPDTLTRWSACWPTTSASRTSPRSRP